MSLDKKDDPMGALAASLSPRQASKEATQELADAELMLAAGKQVNRLLIELNAAKERSAALEGRLGALEQQLEVLPGTFSMIADTMVLKLAEKVRNLNGDVGKYAAKSAVEGIQEAFDETAEKFLRRKTIWARIGDITTSGAAFMIAIALITSAILAYTINENVAETKQTLVDIKKVGDYNYYEIQELKKKKR
ncbi:MAG: hypothetical protein Q7T39_22355 [Polaromonas sp.]|nr:hypothetical protein [Polaromonas sp.]